ncbi:MAG: nitrilase family protein [Chitinophagales bacterium]
MNDLKISTAQFENKSGDKGHNLDIIEAMTSKAAKEGSKVIAFHECCISGYSLARKLSKEEMHKLAEQIPGGSSILVLQQIAAKYDMVILAGLFEKDEKDDLYNSYVCVDKNGLIAKHRKIHPFINPYLKAGNEYTIFNIYGWTCGILICYDNNVIENVRATALLGADILFMPHVTMCTPSTRPGAGFVDPELWNMRKSSPEKLRAEFDGLKGRTWLMKWLPARAYDNGIYVVFSNPIGMDDDQLKNGCSMIIDPFGDIVAECRELGNELQSATIIAEKLSKAGGFRYKNARRPELYGDIIARPHHAELKVAWLNKE